MNITDIQIRFIDGQRPVVVVTFDEPVLEADVRYTVAYEDHFNMHVFRGENGDYVRCGVESKPKGKEFPKCRFKLKDGTTRISHPLLPTNAVAVNALFRMCDPVMDCIIDDKEQGAIHGHVSAVAVAKYLYAAFSAEGITEAPAMACIEWPSGVRVYEPVRAWWDSDNNKWDAKTNVETDKFVFLCTPDDKLTPILVAINNLKEAGTNGGQNASGGT